MQRKRDKYEEKINLRTQLGKANHAEQVMASGFLTTPIQVLRPQTSLVKKNRDVVGRLNSFISTQISQKDLVTRFNGRIVEEKNATFAVNSTELSS